MPGNPLRWEARNEIIIRISVENCTNTGAKVFVVLRANCRTSCYYDFNPWVFLRK